MTLALFFGIIGLALIDALNPATILGVALVLLLPGKRKAATATLFVVGAFLAVFALGTGVYFAASAAADSVSGGLVWLRRIAFGLASAMLLRSAFLSLRTRTQKAIALPGWLTPLTAVPLGVLVTGADLPNAFPYFIAIERLVNVKIEGLFALSVLALYSFIYCLPCLILLVAGTIWNQQIEQRLTGAYARFGSERVVRGSVWKCVGFFVLACVVGFIAASA